MTLRRADDKPFYMLLTCVEAGGPYELGKSYYCLKVYRAGPDQTSFDVYVDGEVRTEYDTRFRPSHKRNWWLFSRAQQKRFAVPPAWDRHWSACPPERRAA